MALIILLSMQFQLDDTRGHYNSLLHLRTEWGNGTTLFCTGFTLGSFDHEEGISRFIILHCCLVHVSISRFSYCLWYTRLLQTFTFIFKF